MLSLCDTFLWVRGSSFIYAITIFIPARNSSTAESHKPLYGVYALVLKIIILVHVTATICEREILPAKQTGTDNWEVHLNILIPAPIHTSQNVKYNMVMVIVFLKCKLHFST